MSRWIRRTAIVVFTLGALAAAAFATAVLLGEHKRTRRIELPARPVALSAAPEVLARGRYLYESRGCTDCHGRDGAGRQFIDDPKTGLKVAGPNISPGPGNVVARYAPADWERTLRHGVKPDGRPLLIMPSEDFARYTDADIAAIASYVRSMPPANGEAAVLQLPLLVRALYGAGVIRDAAQKIDHALPPAQPVAEAITVEHGAYVAQGCKGCHGATLAGGRIPGAPPDWPAAARLVPGEGSAMERYADAQAFRSMLRSGRRPDGSAVSPVMPFEALGRMSDTDVDALYLFLRSGSTAVASNGLPPTR